MNFVFNDGDLIELRNELYYFIKKSWRGSNVDLSLWPVNLTMHTLQELRSKETSIMDRNKNTACGIVLGYLECDSLCDPVYKVYIFNDAKSALIVGSKSNCSFIKKLT